MPRRGFGMVSRNRVQAVLSLTHDGRVLLIVDRIFQRTKK
jgi:hypothetical protein